MILTLLIFLLILTILVIIHELGHFLTAKKFGIKVEEFGFGFPPRAFGIQKGETIYSINWLPIGGFVKLYGEDEAGAGRIATGKEQPVGDERRAFYAKPVWQRAIVVVAGVVMNILLAIAIFYLFLGLGNFKADFLLLTDHNFAFATQQNRNTDDTDIVVSVVSPKSPAEQAGMTPPFEIISVNGKSVIERKPFIDEVNNNRGKEITVEWKDIESGTVHTSAVVPRENPPENEGALGVGFFPVALLSYESGLQKTFSGFAHVYNVAAYTGKIFKKLITLSFEQKTAAPVSEGVSGPVGIYSLVGTIIDIPQFKEKMQQVLNLAGVLSISLAYFNILPIPAVDGGRLFFILFEGVTGRKVSPKIEGMIHTVGMALLLGLLAIITLRDITRLFAS